ncbi:MAG: glycoside hydrolase family 5 protein, partial [Bacteroidota bacterium]|nr:glycoside hydrolase family 5 protein [Bacteroidota bacterium]
TTQQLIDGVKAAGFNAVRIPCAWDSYVEDTISYKIKATWLARVKQVVDYCYKNNMYVILNIHWDGGWLENHPQYAYQEKVNAKQKAYWQQIAAYFRDYDEHLLFAGTNEVHVDYNAPSSENIAVQLSYNQTFVNAVRSTGGKNAYRTLIVQSYNTNISYAVSYMKIPDDTASKRLMVEVHCYDPWDFCGDTGSSAVNLWGASYASYGKISSWGQEDYIKQQFSTIKTNFVDKGYPVILGEFGAVRRSSLTGTTLTNHLASRAYYLGYVTQYAKNNGIVPFYWDNGVTSNNGFALINRSDGSVFDSQALNAIVAGASNGVYPY